MSQTIEDIHSGLISALTGDAGITGWVTTHFGAGAALSTIKANAPVDKIDVNKLPALIMEIGDSNPEVEVQGNLQLVPHDIPFAFVWIEQTGADAWTQRLQLHDLVIKCLLANPSLGVAGAGAWVSEVQSDHNAFHPKHVMRFVVSTEFHVEAA